MYHPFISTYIIEWIAFSFFAFLALIQVFYYLRIFIPPLFRKAPTTHSTNKQGISVIICARNEASNLAQNLPKILQQDYPEYEVIVVNDCSTDTTDEVLASLMKEYPNLRTTSIHPDRKFTHGKKLAVMVGIKSAKNDWLVFTDADCFPVSNKWLSCLSANFDKNEIVLGYGGYENHKGLLNLYIRTETVFVAAHYLGFAHAGVPYMGVGRNLAYMKKVFFRHKGFASHYNILSGDDDLFINEAASAKNTTIELRVDAHTRSVPEKRWPLFFKQKIRHYTTSSFYKPKHQLLLGLEPLTRLGFYFFFVLLLVINVQTWLVLGAFGLRFLLQLWLGILADTKLNDKKIFVALPFYDIASLFINVVLIIISNTRVQKLKWK